MHAGPQVRADSEPGSAYYRRPQPKPDAGDQSAQSAEPAEPRSSAEAADGATLDGVTLHTGPAADAFIASAAAANGADGPSPEAVSILGRLGPGAPLDPAVAARLAPGAGGPGGDVRVHTDGQAAGIAASIGARAFSIGLHIGFGADEYQPGTPGGTRCSRTSWPTRTSRPTSSPAAPSAKRTRPRPRPFWGRPAQPGAREGARAWRSGAAA